MTFYAFGLNYEQAPVETTEAFALGGSEQMDLYESLSLDDESEVIFLSTCNRTEVYLYGTAGDVSRIQRTLSERAGCRWPDAASFLYEDEAAVRHVLQVTSGIRSMVLGDGQILMQVKDAYRRAVDAGAVTSLLHRLMHTAFRAAKRVATETNLASGAASVSTAAVAMARDHFADHGSPDDLQGVHVLMVGAGKMGRLALDALDGYAPASVTVTNRSPERAQQVAQAHDASVVDWSDRYDAVADADFVIVATGAPEPVLRAGGLPMACPVSLETLLVDISMPRNIDPVIDESDGYRVFDLDDLQAYTEQVQAERGSEVPEAEAICEEILGDFVTWVFHQQALQPAIQAIRDTFDTIREQEVERHAHRTGMKRDEVDRLTRSIMQKLLAVPIVKLKNVDPDSIDFVRGIQLLHALFSRPTCEDESAQAARDRQSERTSTPATASEGEPTSDDASEASSRPRLADAPSSCPFGTEDPSSSDEADALLRQVLQGAGQDRRQ